MLKERTWPMLLTTKNRLCSFYYVQSLSLSDVKGLNILLRSVKHQLNKYETFLGEPLFGFIIRAKTFMIHPLMLKIDYFSWKRGEGKNVHS